MDARSIAALLAVFTVAGFWAAAPASAADSPIPLASGAGVTPPPFGTVQDPSVQVSFDDQNWSPAFAADGSGYWPTPFPGSTWDVPSPNRDQGYGDPQNIYYRISFTLPAGFPSPSLAGVMGADDQPVAVSLNGTTIASYPYEGYVYDPSPHAFSTSDASLFQTGTNVLELETLNLGGVTALDFSALVTPLDDLTLAPLPDQTVDATSPSGAVVSFSPQASDPDDNTAPVVSCDHASGSVFPIGTTLVNCTATDSDGESPQTVSFTVTVLGAADQASSLAAVAQSFGGSFSGQVQSALTSLAAGNANTAANQLRAFENHVRAQSGKQIPAGEATALIASAQQIITLIGQ